MPIRTTLLALVALGVCCPTANATVLRNLDFQTPGLVDGQGRPWQWENYVPGDAGTSGISLGSPGTLPAGYRQAARFQPELTRTGRPRSQAKLAKDSTADRGVALGGPLDAAEGLNRWYLWWTYLPGDFDIPSDAPRGAATVLQAWHNDSSQSACNPNIQLVVRRLNRRDDVLRLQLRVQGGRHASSRPVTWQAEGSNGDYCYTETFREVDLGPIVRGRWVQWGMHARWSPDPSAGLTEIWRDAQPFSVPGANLYRSDLGVPERGFMEHGIYMPVEDEPAARLRSVWHVGMRIADSAADVVPLLGVDPGSPSSATTVGGVREASVCRSLKATARSVRFGRRRVGARLSGVSSARRSPVLRLLDPHRVVRRATVTLEGRRMRLRDRRVTVPPVAFTRAQRTTLRVRLTPKRGRARTLVVRVTARPCR